MSSFSVLKVQSFLGNLFEGLILGGLWGTSVLSAIIALIFAFVDGKQGIIGGLIVGAMWGAFLGVAISLFIPPPGGLNRGSALLLGGWFGIFVAAVICGFIFGALERQPVIGQALMWGMVMGMIWGSVWHLFKPPLSLPNVGRLWGRRGAFVGGVWGSCLGTLAGTVLAIVAVSWQYVQAGNRFVNLSPAMVEEIALRFVATIIVAAGVGALGGILTGLVFGTVGGAPSLPLSMSLSGRRGAFIGSIWGNFLGAISGAGLGLLGVTAFAEFLQVSHTTGSTPLLVGAMIISAGIGGIWGLISGSVWGAFGKF